MAKNFTTVDLSDGKRYIVDASMKLVKEVRPPYDFQSFADLSEDDMDIVNAAIGSQATVSYEETVEKLKEIIQIELDACDTENTPKVCELKSTPEGYEKIEKLIINKIGYEGHSIASAIIDIEKEFNPNLQND